MNRLEMLKNTDRKHLVLYTMAGDPDLKTTEELIYTMAGNGVSLIELGVPFSDPVADGITIQLAGERSLKKGTNLHKVLELSQKVRKSVTIPMVLMLYYNLIYAYGVKKFVDDALKAGIDGAIVPDLPFDEEKEFSDYAAKKGFYIVYLVSPTNTPARMKKIVEKSKGFVYYILLKGVTGARNRPESELKALLAVRKLSKNPVFAGFGISTPEQARSVSRLADGVIIGSAFVKLAEKYGNNRNRLRVESVKFIKSFLKEL